MTHGHIVHEQPYQKDVQGGYCNFKRITWSAIIIGALVGIGLSFLLNLFSVAIGLSVFSVSTEGMVSLAIGGLIGLIFGSIVVMFLSGFTAGYLAKPFCRGCNLGILYGFTTWSLALVVTILLTSHVGRFVASYANFISNPATSIVSANETTPMMGDTTAPGAVNVNAERATNTIGLGAFVVFILFFIGAISCCVGAYWGLEWADDHTIRRDEKMSVG